MNLDIKIGKYFDKCLDIFSDAGIVLPKDATINIYHHLGKENIDEFGACFINVVNRDYCKSYVVMIEGQEYPNHYHRIKTESFYVLYGDLHVVLDGEKIELTAGEMLHVEREQDHSFGSLHGVVFEEISTMYVPNDSIYLDDNVKNTTYEQRRTTIKAFEWKEIRESCRK